MNGAAPMLEFVSIDKSFFGVPVLKNICFRLGEGQALGLVGENGAGKSTLMNILGGIHPPDAGQMFLGGKTYAPRHPQDALRHRVAFIHQELNLFGNLSIAENLFLTAFPATPVLPLIRRQPMRQRARALLAQVGLNLSPDTPVEKLSAGERQLVEIAKALASRARLIIFDEPTTSLTLRETDRLFTLIGQLRAQGLSLIYISHNLGDVLRLCDAIVVLRDGEQVGQGATEGFTLEGLVSLMVGRNITHLFPARPTVPKPAPLLEVRGLSQPGIVRDISFTLHRGEVLGLAGLMGSGRSELARLLFGLDPYAQGRIILDGKPLRPTPRRSIQRGLAFLTENRREEGLCLEASIADNLALVTLPAQARSGWVNRKGLAQAVEQIRRVVPWTPAARLDRPVRTLSGGNQQKVVLAKWLLAKPSVFLLDEPTRGIDVGAKSEIYHLINTLSAQEAGVLVISSEIEELIGLCDRILVMNRGEIRDEIPRAAFNRERILRAALHDQGGFEATP